MWSHPYYPLMNFSLCFNTHDFNYQPYKSEYSFICVCVIKNEMKSFDLFYNECMWCSVCETLPLVLTYSELKDKGDQWQNNLRSSLCVMINVYIIIYISWVKCATQQNTEKLMVDSLSWMLQPFCESKWIRKFHVGKVKALFHQPPYAHTIIKFFPLRYL